MKSCRQVAKEPLQRNVHSPTVDEWLKIVGEIFEMEPLTHKRRTQEENCKDKWKKNG